jgi:hypothetical protein
MMAEAEWDPRLLRQFLDVSDQPALLAFASELLSETLRENDGKVGGAYAYLLANSSSIAKRLSAFDPMALVYWRAIDLVREHLYWLVVCAPIDRDRLCTYYIEFQTQAMGQGGGTVEGALTWMNDNMMRIVAANVADQKDWALRNRAWGFVQKRMQFEKAFGPQPPIDWEALAAGRDPPYAVLPK